MTTYKIIFGRFKAPGAGNGGWLGAEGQFSDAGEPLDSEIELSDKEAKLMDPDGTALQPLNEWKKAQAGEKAKAAAIAKLDAEEAAAKGSADAKKAGGK